MHPRARRSLHTSLASLVLAAAIPPTALALPADRAPRTRAAVAGSSHGSGRDAAATLRDLAAHHTALAGGTPSAAPAAGRKYQAGAGARTPTDADLSALLRRPSTQLRAVQNEARAAAAVHGALAGRR
jgi:hypothetical protein